MVKYLLRIAREQAISYLMKLMLLVKTLILAGLKMWKDSLKVMVLHMFLLTLAR